MSVSTPTPASAATPSPSLAWRPPASSRSPSPSPSPSLSPSLAWQPPASTAPPDPSHLSVLPLLPPPAHRAPLTYYRALGGNGVVRTSSSKNTAHTVCALCISKGLRPLQANYRHTSGNFSCAGHVESDVEWAALGRPQPSKPRRCAIRFNANDVVPWPHHAACVSVGTVYIEPNGEYSRQRPRSIAKLCRACAQRGNAVIGRWCGEYETRLCPRHRAAMRTPGSPSLRAR